MKINSIIQTPTTHNVSDSNQFYERLGFEKIEAGDDNLYSDGKVLIGVNSERTARTTIRLFGNWEKELSQLQETTCVTLNDGVALLSDPNGVFVQLEPEQIHELGGEPKSALGNFQGMSIETTDFDRTADFWKMLGYAITMGAPEQGWIALEREGMVGISIMKAGACPHMFVSPGLTYFNSGKNLENIAKIREAGVAITEEITCFNQDGIVDNVILRDPGGTCFFIFND